MFDTQLTNDDALLIPDADDDIEQILSMEIEGRWRSRADLAYLLEMAGVCD